MKYLPLLDPCLEWKIDFTKYKYLIQEHISKISTQLEYFLVSTPLEENIANKFNSFTDEEKLHFLIDPNVAEIINVLEQANEQETKTLLAQLAKYVQFYFKKEYQTNDLFLRNGIRVEFNSIIHTTKGHNLTPLSREKAETISLKLEKALTFISLHSPETYSLINLFTSLIHLRNESNRPNYASWSTHIGIGKIVASNIHYIEDSPEELVDFLIHESIHNFLHLIEENHGAFLEDEAFEKNWIKEKIISSPWSGVGVDLGSYTHAISVWYGLFNFWDKVHLKNDICEDYISQKKINKMRNQAAKGFLKKDSVYHVLKEKFSFIEKDYLNATNNFQSRVFNQELSYV